MNMPARIWRYLAPLGLLVSQAHGQPQQLELIPFGADWSYLDTGLDPGPDWILPSFDDDGWLEGPAELGYGEGDEASVVSFGPDANDRHITTWFRHSFEVANVDDWQSLRLFLKRDDGAAVYLNGTLLRFDRLPWQGFDSSTLSDGNVEGLEEQEPQGFDHGVELLVQGTNVLAVELHQSDVTSDDLSFDLRLVASPLAAVVQGPYLQLDTSRSMRLRWTTATPAPSSVRYGLDPNFLTDRITDPALRTRHDILIEDLLANTAYYYDLGLDVEPALPGRELRFRTPPLAADQSSRFWVMGDSGTANDSARRVRDGLELATDIDPDLWLFLGDIAYTQGDETAFQRGFFDMYSEQLVRVPVISVRGNHENDEELYYDIFDFPTQASLGGVPSGSEAYYSLRWGNVHFVCLDSYITDRSVGAAMHTWLETDLAANDAEWLVAAWHHPPYSAGTHNSDVDVREREMRENFLPLLEAAGVDLVLAGHSHGYERSFLIDGHYGPSSTFGSSMLLDGGSGQPAGTGAYSKLQGPHAGTIYTVAGSSGDVREANYNHPVMFVSGPVLGSLLIDVEGTQLDYSFIGVDGNVQDSFRLIHESPIETYCPPTPHSQGCAVPISSNGSPSLSGATPFEIRAEQLPPNVIGLLVYGFAPANIPLFEGSLCVAPPFARRDPSGSGGSGLCNGQLTDDFGSLLVSQSVPELQVGASVFTQFWYRDAQSATGANFSEALTFVILP